MTALTPVRSTARSHLATYALAALAVTVVVAMVADPELAFRSALNGLRVWWDIVFPALLPFFIGGQVLMGLGVVHFMGVLLEPAMRPLFNVPGSGSFVLAMGLASGYPIGAVLTARMRREGLLTREEAERLMSCANTADPLFMAGAVAVGMFGNARLAGLIMAAHYLGAVATGLLLKFYRRDAPVTPPPAPGTGSLLARAAGALVNARQRDARPLGKLLGDAVRDSVQTLLLIGGFIILFSVIIQMLRQMGAVAALVALLARPLSALGMDPATLPGLVSGVFEITIGTQAVAGADASLLHRVVAASAIIAWSGLSVLGQVAAIVQGTDIRLAPYVLARLFHALAAAALTVVLFAPGEHLAALPVAPGRHEVLPAVTGKARLLGVPVGEDRAAHPRPGPVGGLPVAAAPGPVAPGPGGWVARLGVSAAAFLAATLALAGASGLGGLAAAAAALAPLGRRRARAP